MPVGLELVSGLGEGKLSVGGLASRERLLGLGRAMVRGSGNARELRGRVGRGGSGQRRGV